MMKISFVIPCYRSEKTIESVVDEIKSVILAKLQCDYEVIAVNDNSPDNVWQVLCDLAKADPEHIKAVRFAKNFGQHAGIMAGLRYATGDIAVLLDDDGQCPVDHLDELIKPLEEGANVTIAEYGKKKQSLFKNMCSRANEIAANLLIEKPKSIQLGNFMAIDRVMIDETVKYQGPYPCASGLFFRASAKVVNVPMEERKRMVGGTTYNLKKLLSLWLNSFTAFSIKPLRFSIVLGAVTAAIGFIYMIVLFVRKLMHLTGADGWSSIMVAMLLIGGMVLFSLGIIGEYIGRIYMSVNNTPQYVIAEGKNVDV